MDPSQGNRARWLSTTSESVEKSLFETSPAAVALGPDAVSNYGHHPAEWNRILDL